MSKVKILVVEDELIIAEDIQNMLDKLGYEVVGIGMDFSEGVSLLETTRPDIVLTDITLGGSKDGIDLAKIISTQYRLPFIFITSHSDKLTVERAKGTRPNGYLVKPFESDDLYTAIEVALCNYSGVAQPQEDKGETGMLIRDSIYVKEGHLFVKVKLNDLRWIMSEGNYLELHTDSKRYVIRSSFREFMEKLPTDHFFRVHKSYAVNLSYIDAINSLHVIVNEVQIPIGRNFRDLLLKRVQTA